MATTFGLENRRTETEPKPLISKRALSKCCVQASTGPVPSWALDIYVCCRKRHGEAEIQVASWLAGSSPSAALRASPPPPQPLVFSFCDHGFS